MNRAIDTLVPIIAKDDVEPRVRQRWLERLWQDDGIPYIETLGDKWGDLGSRSPPASLHCVGVTRARLGHHRR